MIEETIFNNGDDFFNSLQADIASARKFIHLETYIFDQDLTGNRILSLLAEAANRGVHTQLLLNKIDSSA